MYHLTTPPYFNLSASTLDPYLEAASPSPTQVRGADAKWLLEQWEDEGGKGKQDRRLVDYSVEEVDQWLDRLMNDGAEEEWDRSAEDGVPLGLEFENDDAAWIMACTFIIFTMQTGFGYLESGMCSMKNEVNILMKNMVDVALGGFVFWMFGFGLAMGDGPGTTPFYGVGDFFFAPDVNVKGSGEKYLRFFIQVAFVSSSTTIVSGAMAERCNFNAFMLFCLANVFTYSIPAHWVWGQKGWLKGIGVLDIAGSGVVHALGGISGLVASVMLGPRLGVEKQRERIIMGNAQNSLVGLFMLWWAFLAFNSGSTFGVTDDKWMFSAKATVVTMISSFGGGCVGLAICYLVYGGKMKVMYVANCVFSSLVAITGSSYLVSTWQAFLIGGMAAFLCFCAMKAAERSTRLDDPCASFAVHGVAGTWGLIAVGIFARADPRIEGGDTKGAIEGDFHLLLVQALAAVVILAWGATTTFVWLKVIGCVVPVRMSTVDELLGADYSVHNILHPDIGVEEAVEALGEFHDVAEGIQPTGNNLGHTMYLEDHFASSLTQSQRLNRLSRALSAHFGHGVTDDDVMEYDRRAGWRGQAGGRARTARRSELRDVLSFERHVHMPSRGGGDHDDDRGRY